MPKIYGYTEINGDLLVTGSFATPPISITKASLSSLVTSGSVSVGSYYAITDFQDKNILDTNSRVIIQGVGTSSVSHSGVWTRLTQNKPFSSFNLTTGATGNSVNQITVGSTPLLTATVSATSSNKISFATDVVSGVNANTSTSGFKAYLIAGDTTTDTPSIVIERTTAGVLTSSVSVSVTGATATLVSVMGMGQSQIKQTLPITYDLAADRITRCFDDSYGCELIYSVSTIATLGYNPITEFRWGHSNIRNWKLNNTDYTNFFITSTLTGSNTLEQNNVFNNGALKNCILRRTNTTSVSFSNNTGTITLDNVNAPGLFRMNNNSVNIITLQNVTSLSTSSSFSILSNVGGGAIKLGTTGFSTGSAIQSNTVHGTISVFGAIFSLVTFNISGCSILSGQLGFAASTTFTAGISFTGVTITSGLVLPSAGTKIFAINMSNSKLDTFSCQNFDITVASKTLAITSCDFKYGCFISGSRINSALFGKTTLDVSTTLTCTTGAGGWNLTDVVISSGTYDFGLTTSVIITSSSIIEGSLIAMYQNPGAGAFTLSNSTLRNVTMTDRSSSFDISQCVIESSIISNVISTLVSSNIKNSVLTSNVGAGNGVVTYNTCNIIGSTVSSVDNGVLPTNFANCEFVNSTITYGSVVMVGNMSDSQITDSTISFVLSGISTIDSNITGLKMFKSDFSEWSISSADYLTINNLSLEYSNIKLDTILIASDSSVKLTKLIPYYASVSIKNTLVNTSINNGKVVIKGLVDVNTLSVGVPLLITDLPNYFVHEQTTYTSINGFGGLTGSTASYLQLGIAPTYDQFITPSSVSTLNSTQAHRNQSFLPSLMPVVDSYPLMIEVIGATMSSNGSGTNFIFIIEGTILQDNVGN